MDAFLRFEDRNPVNSHAEIQRVNHMVNGRNNFHSPGLRSRTLHEKLATIVNMTTFLRENPFPFFVNAAVLRLCEAFRDE